MAGHQSSRAAKQQRSKAGKAISSITKQQVIRASMAAKQQGKQSFRPTKKQSSSTAGQGWQQGSRPSKAAGKQAGRQSNRSEQRGSRAHRTLGQQVKGPARQQSKCIGESMFTSRFPGPDLVPGKWAQIWGRSKVTKSTF